MYIQQHCCLSQETPLDNTPVIVLHDCTGRNPLSAKKISVIFDDTYVIDHEAGHDFMSAVAWLMATYFLFGVVYPPGLQTTLIFLERYVCGLKESKKGVPIQRLINALYKAWNVTPATTKFAGVYLLVRQ